MSVNGILIMIMVLPLAGALLALVAPSGRVARGLAVGVSALTLAFTLALFPAFRGQGLQVGFTLPWLADTGITLSFALDGISYVAFLLTAIVAFAGVLVSRETRGRGHEFYALYLALTGGAFGAFASTNLFFFYFFAEFEVLCSYLLIAGWSSRGDSIFCSNRRSAGIVNMKMPPETAATTVGQEPASRAAMRMTLFVAAGAVVTLLAFLALAALGGSFDLAALGAALRQHPLPVMTQKVLFVMLLAGFGVLLSVWPLHVWAPPAYAAAPTPVSMLSAGVLKQLGAYGLIRFAIPLLPDGARWCVPYLAVLAIVNILYGGWIALRQKDWKLLISYGAISHAGYILLGLAALNRVGIGGVVMMMFAGALSVALLFALAGTMEEQAGTRDITRFSGLARHAPFIGGCTVMAALAAAGLPGFTGFVSEVLVLAGGWMEGSFVLRAAVVAGAWGLVLTAVYMLWAVRNGVFGPPAADILKVQDAHTVKARLPYLLLLAALLAVGIWPRLLVDPIQRSVATITAAQERGMGVSPMKHGQDARATLATQTLTGKP